MICKARKHLLLKEAFNAFFKKFAVTAHRTSLIKCVTEWGNMLSSLNEAVALVAQCAKNMFHLTLMYIVQYVYGIKCTMN